MRIYLFLRLSKVDEIIVTTISLNWKKFGKLCLIWKFWIFILVVRGGRKSGVLEIHPFDGVFRRGGFVEAYAPNWPSLGVLDQLVLWHDDRSMAENFN